MVPPKNREGKPTLGVLRRLSSRRVPPLYAAEVHGLRVGEALRPEHELAMALQHDRLAREEERLAAGDAHQRAVRAVILEHECTLVELHYAMPARSHAIGDHQAAAVLAPDHHRLELARNADTLLAACELHGDGPAPWRARRRRAVVGHELAHLDELPALAQPDRLVARHAAESGRTQRRGGLPRGERLAFPRRLEKARRELHGVAENVVVVFDHRPAMEADVHAELEVVHRG